MYLVAHFHTVYCVCVYTGAPSTLSPTDPIPVTRYQFPLAGVIAGKANTIKCVAKITPIYL